MNFDAIWCSIYHKDKPRQTEKGRINQLEETKARNMTEIEDEKIVKDEAALQNHGSY